MAFEPNQKVIVKQHIESNETYQNVAAIFECPGPLAEECSVLIPREGLPKLRLHRVALCNIEAAPKKD